MNHPVYCDTEEESNNIPDEEQVFLSVNNGTSAVCYNICTSTRTGRMSHKPILSYDFIALCVLNMASVLYIKRDLISTIKVYTNLAKL
jgi:hypothetical protein